MDAVASWLPAVAGHALIEVLAPARACVCSFVGSEVNPLLLGLLQKQLARCGPEHLSRESSSGAGVLIAVACSGVLVGVAIGYLGRLIQKDGCPGFVPWRAAAWPAGAGPYGAGALLRRSGGHLARAAIDQ
jgi:hypothetical protein